MDHPGAGDNALFIFLVYLPYRARACHTGENEHSLDGRERARTFASDEMRMLRAVTLTSRHSYIISFRTNLHEISESFTFKPSGRSSCGPEAVHGSAARLQRRRRRR